MLNKNRPIRRTNPLGKSAWQLGIAVYEPHQSAATDLADPGPHPAGAARARATGARRFERDRRDESGVSGFAARY